MSPSTKRENWSKEAMCLAVRVVRCGDIGYLRASKHFSLPRGTLDVTDASRSPEELVNTHLGRISLLPSEHGNKLVEWSLTMDQRYFKKASGIIIENP
jgi:hypothetical protein